MCALLSAATNRSGVAQAIENNGLLYWVNFHADTYKIFLENLDEHGHIIHLFHQKCSCVNQVSLKVNVSCLLNVSAIKLLPNLGNNLFTKVHVNALMILWQRY